MIALIKSCPGRHGAIADATAIAQWEKTLLREEGNLAEVYKGAREHHGGRVAARRFRIRKDG